MGPDETPSPRPGSRRAIRVLWVGLVLVAVTAAVAVEGTLTFIGATRRVEQTLVNIERLNALLSLLKDAETGPGLRSALLDRPPVRARPIQ